MHLKGVTKEKIEQPRKHTNTYTKAGTLIYCTDIIARQRARTGPELSAAPPAPLDTRHSAKT